MINEEHGSTAVAQLTVSAFRMSADPARSGTFLEAIGLSPVVSNAGNTWLELRGAAGSVSLHAVAAAADPAVVPGSTDLVLITPDVTSLARQLEADGVVIDVWDEAFGRQAALRLGTRTMWINEEQNDFYGYEAHDGRPGPVTVVVHCFTEDVAGVRGILELLGFRGEQDDREALRLTPSARAGIVQLHHGQGPDRYEIGLETSEELTAVEGRLRSRGIEVSQEAATGVLVVRDPDGQRVTITAATAQ